jgi:hypothetical protein
MIDSTGVDAFVQSMSGWLGWESSAAGKKFFAIRQIMGRSKPNSGQFVAVRLESPSRMPAAMG